MTQHDYDSESLRIAAWGDLRHYVQRPAIYRHHANLGELVRSLWLVYLIRSGLWGSYADFEAEAYQRAAMFAKQLAGGLR